MVFSELQRHAKQNPPTVGASQATRLSNFLGEPIDPEGLGEEEAIFALQADLRNPGDHDSKHSGEATTIVIAKRLRAAVCSDDRGALRVAFSTYGLQTACATTVVQAIVSSGLLTGAAGIGALRGAQAVRRIRPEWGGGACHHASSLRQHGLT